MLVGIILIPEYLRQRFWVTKAFEVPKTGMVARRELQYVHLIAMRISGQ